MVTRILVKKKPEYSATHMQRMAASMGLADIDVRRAYFIESTQPLPAAHLELLCRTLADTVVEAADAGAPNKTGHECWVAYQRGIVDNECDSIVRMCELIGIEANAAKVATVYCSSDARLGHVVESRFFNPNIEEIHSAEPHYETLHPSGQYVPMETFDLRGLDAPQLEALGRAAGRNLNVPMMTQIQQIQEETGSPYVTDVLLEAMDARWSDHCYHTTWKSLGQLLKRLMEAARATNNPNIISMFEDNAGVWDFYDGQAVALKAETHNGPSAISAYFGQLTKLGGVLRDILGAGQGADPVGVYEYTATGIPGTPSPIAGRPSPTQIAHETIRAIKEYGNTFGTPMMWSQMTFHPAYRAKPFALGGCIGIIPKELAQKGVPEKGDMLMLIGGLTGNDGIHGASASSAGAQMDTAAVQIGSPLEQVKFRAAIIDLRDAGCIRALTDVGGAGLNSAVGEIGDPCGVWINTALVPLKTVGLPMWRILLSESQERMILALRPEKLAESRAILARHEVRHTVIGRFTGEGRYTVIHDASLQESEVVTTDAGHMPRTGEVGIDTPYRLLKYEPEPQAVPDASTRGFGMAFWPRWSAAELQIHAPKLLADSEVASQMESSMQYDSTVQGRQTYGPYFGESTRVPTGYWAARLIPDKPYASLFTTSFNPWLFEMNPKLATRQCFLACVQKLVLAGSKVADICLCDNFYTPHMTGDWAYWLVEMVDEIASLVRRFGTPVISGKDSSAGSVKTSDGVVSVPPAVFFSALGKAPDFAKLLPNEWRAAGNVLMRIGPNTASTAGTVAQRVLHLDRGKANDVDAVAYVEYLKALEGLDRTKVFSGSAIEAGGMLAMAARTSLATGIGVQFDVPGPEMLQEHRCGALIEVAPGTKLAAALNPRKVGTLIAGPPSVRLQGQELLTAAAIKSWRTSFQESLQ